MSAFCCKKSVVFGKNITFTQSIIESCFKDFFSVFSFRKIGGYNQWKCIMKIIDHSSGIRVPNYSKSTINWQIDVIIGWHDVIVKWRCFFLVKFSYWPKFHVNIITGFGVTKFFVQKRFDWKSGNRKYTPVWVFLWWVRDTKFAMNVSNEMLGNAVKCQVCSFYRFWVIKGKLTGGR